MWLIISTDKYQEQKTKDFLENTYSGIIRQVYFLRLVPFWMAMMERVLKVSSFKSIIFLLVGGIVAVLIRKIV